MDATLRAAEVKLAKWIQPPLETNFGGRSSRGRCRRWRPARDAFVEAVASVARAPLDGLRKASHERH